jgi:zinc/manganese transport system substrate-binding protein
MFRVSSAVTAVAWQENEHLWYSISAVGVVAYALAETLGALDPNNSAAYLTNADQLVEGLTGVAAMYGEVRKVTEGYTYFGTEPLAAWLLADIGFINKTPVEFSAAIENETDVPPSVMKESLDLIKSGEIKYLVINSQTQNSQVQQIVDAARDAGVRAVMLSEVLPAGTTYVEWMGNNLITLDPSK